MERVGTSGVKLPQWFQVLHNSTLISAGSLVVQLTVAEKGVTFVTDHFNGQGDVTSGKGTGVWLGKGVGKGVNIGAGVGKGVGEITGGTQAVVKVLYP